MKLYAVAPPGLEPAVEAELSALGITGRIVGGGVEWDGDASSMRRANLHLRCATRVLLRLAEFRARTFFELERHAARVDWSSVLGGGRAVALRVTAKKSKLYHERAIAQRLQTAIAAAAGASFATGAIDEEEGDARTQLIIVRVLRDEFTISADSSGEALHRRGYREAIGKAPLRESLAAGLLWFAGWNADSALVDPFCGSGTIPTEAALIARRIAPGIARADRAPRAFAFTAWPRFEARAWRAEVQEAVDVVLPASPVPLFGSDRNAGAIEIARQNAARAGVVDDVSWQVAPLGRAEIPEGATLVTNPPYGVRVASGDAELRDLWAALGRVLRDRIGEAGGAALLSPDRSLEGQLNAGLVVAAESRNGGIPVKVLARPRAAAVPSQ